MNKNQVLALSIVEEILTKHGEKATRQEIQEVILSKGLTKGQLAGCLVYMKWAEKEAKRKMGNPQGGNK